MTNDELGVLFKIQEQCPNSSFVTRIIRHLTGKGQKKRANGLKNH